MKKILFTTICCFIVFNFLLAAGQQQNKATYVPKKKDKIITPIIEKQEALDDQRDIETKAILKEERARKKEVKAKRKRLVADMTGVFPPKSPEEFKQHFHFPPISQFMTDTCWSFAGVSYFESEIFRLTGKKIKLSEMWTPYFEMLEKCRRYIQKRGYSYVAGGGEANSVTRIWKQYGMVPAEAYPGVCAKDGQHNHKPLLAEVRSYLKYIKEEKLWDEEANLKHIALIMDKYMGKPPQSFVYEGKTITPIEFLKTVGLNMDDYYSTMSTLYFPFYTMDQLRVPDNWWINKEYINLPLDVWYGLLKKAHNAGHTVFLGGDISEPGKLAEQDVAFIPGFDIPPGHINQTSREYRISNKTTTDDHSIHMVGHKRYKGKDWFLIKDSSRSSRRGKFEGYYFFREDFIKLIMFFIIVHNDILKIILPMLI
ncbi:MAG: peptidase C1 [bacterium]|nr:peptidase C1 [bacterium]